MDYNKINKVEIDGNGNIVLQNVNGENITVNYNDTKELANLIQSLNNKQTFNLKEMIGSQHKLVLEEIRKVQQQIDEQNIEQQAEQVNLNLDDFFKELNLIKIDGLKKRILTDYKLLREYEEIIIFEDNPRKKMKNKNEMNEIKSRIEISENELRAIAKNTK